MRENVEPGTQNIIGFIRVMAFINYLSEHPELKEVNYPRPYLPPGE